jgi:hypothetical protein
MLSPDMSRLETPYLPSMSEQAIMHKSSPRAANFRIADHTSRTLVMTWSCLTADDWCNIKAVGSKNFLYFYIVRYIVRYVFG